MKDNYRLQREWTTFVNKGDKDLLLEMDDKYIKLIKGATEYAKENPDELPFPSVFENKLRFAIPLVQNELKLVSKILYVLEDEYTRVQNYNKTRTKYKLQIVPKTVKVKQRLPNNAGFQEVEKTINDVLIQELMTYNEGVVMPDLSWIKQKITDPQSGETRVETKTYTVVSALQNLIRLAKNEIKRIDNKTHPVDSQYTLNILKERNNTIVNVVQKMIDWWNKNQSKVVQDPTLLSSSLEIVKRGDSDLNQEWSDFDYDLTQQDKKDNYSIIFSRMPIDVLRMSDFEETGIRSCHSTPDIYDEPNYFECALMEAQNEGAIAYLVKTSDLERVNLNEDEIFADKNRNLKGIVPILRIRIRTIKNLETNDTIAAVEQKIYGDARVFGFQKYVEEYVAKKQTDLLVKEDEDGNKTLNIPDSSKLLKIGGSYVDSPGISYFLKNLFINVARFEKIEISDEQKNVLERFYIRSQSKDKELELSRYVDKVDQDDQDNEYEIDQAAREAAYEEYRSIIRTFNTEIFDINSDFNWIEYDGERINFKATISFTIPYSKINPYLLNRETEEEADVETTFEMYLRETRLSEWLQYPNVEIDLDDCYITKDDFNRLITFNITYHTDQSYNVEEFRDAILELRSFEAEYNVIEKIFSDFKTLKLIDNEEEIPGIQKFRNFISSLTKSKGGLEYVGLHNKHFTLVADRKSEKYKYLFLVMRLPYNMMERIAPHIIHFKDRPYDQVEISRSYTQRIEMLITETLKKDFTNLVLTTGTRDMFGRPIDIYSQLGSDVERELPDGLSIKLHLRAVPHIASKSYLERSPPVIDYYNIYAQIFLDVSIKSTRDYDSLLVFLRAVDDNPFHFQNLITKMMRTTPEMKEPVKEISENKKKLIKQKLLNWYNKNGR